MKCSHCGSEWNTTNMMMSSSVICPFCGESILREAKSSEIEIVLADMKQTIGPDIMSNGELLCAYLADIAPNLRQERNLLRYLYECSGDLMLCKVKDGNDADIQLTINKVIDRMYEDLCVDKSLADRICRAYIYAISGKKIECKVMEASYAKPVKEEVHSKEKNNSENSDKDELSVAELYYIGMGYFQNAQKKSQNSEYQNSLVWFNRAANKGHAASQCQLGVCYRDGLGVKKNGTTALSFFIEATENDKKYAPAFFYLAKCYQYGIGTEIAMPKALKCYATAGELNYLEAQLEMGRRYENGDGVKQNWNRALEWYELASQNGDKGDNLNRVKELLKKEDGERKKSSIDLDDLTHTMNAYRAEKWYLRRGQDIFENKLSKIFKEYGFKESVKGNVLMIEQPVPTANDALYEGILLTMGKLQYVSRSKIVSYELSLIDAISVKTNANNHSKEVVACCRGGQELVLYRGMTRAEMVKVFWEDLLGL